MQAPAAGVKLQPAVASQLALVHGLPSVQRPALAWCLQELSAPQLSTVHLTPSSQALAAAARWTQPNGSLQTSQVQGYPSSQLLGKLTHFPPKHASLTVHAWPSSQPPSTATWAHWPVFFWHWALVQAVLSTVLQVMSVAGLTLQLGLPAMDLSQ